MCDSGRVGRRNVVIVVGGCVENWKSPDRTHSMLWSEDPVSPHVNINNAMQVSDSWCLSMFHQNTDSSSVRLFSAFATR